MKNEFVPYNIALAMQKLNYDGKCLGVIYPDGQVIAGAEGFAEIMMKKDSECIKAILTQQLISWFRKRGLYPHVKQDWDNGKLLGYEAVIEDKDGSTDCGTYSTPEIAEIACISKLIERESEIHPLALLINDKFVITNGVEGTGTGVVIHNQFTFKKELKELTELQVNQELLFNSIDWRCEYHKMYWENGYVMSIEAIKDQEHLSKWLKEFEKESHHSFRILKY